MPDSTKNHPFPLILILFFLPFQALSRTEEASFYTREIRRIENLIKNSQSELEFLVSEKKKIRSSVHTNETQERIIKINVRLISLKAQQGALEKKFKKAHPKEFDNMYKNRKRALKTELEERNPHSLMGKLNHLHSKAHRKFSSVVESRRDKKETLEVEKILKAKEKENKEKGSESYLQDKIRIEVVE